MGFARQQLGLTLPALRTGDSRDPHALAEALNAQLYTAAVRVGGGAVVGLPALASGFAALDRATRLGGFPRGRITELIGRPTAGRATVAMRTVAAAGGFSAWVDVAGLVDVDALAAAGADLSRVFIIRPRRPLDALAMAAHLLAAGHFSTVVLDALSDLTPDGATAQAMAKFVRVVTPALGRHGTTAALILSHPEHTYRPLAHAAALRIGFTRVGLIRPGGVFRGWRTRARILKSPGLQGGELGIEVWL